jgi:hypothetical protein
LNEPLNVEAPRRKIYVYRLLLSVRMLKPEGSCAPETDSEDPRPTRFEVVDMG